MNVRLDTLTNIGRFASDMAEGYIRSSADEDDDRYVMLCYTPKTQFSGNWIEDTTILARGLAVRLAEGDNGRLKSGNVGIIADALKDATVVARGMRKFFTVDASASEWGTVKLVDDDENVTVSDDYSIDFNAPASVSDKLDGALGIGVPIDGRLIIATKGAFQSDEAVVGTQYLHGKHDAPAFLRFLTDELHGDMTPLFEIITPEADHVVDYGDYADIVFLGLMTIRDGHWIPAARLDTDARTAGTRAKDIPSLFGFRTPEPYNAASLSDALRMKEIPNHEGMVVTLNTEPQRMFKVKYATFLELQRLKNLNGNSIARMIMDMDDDSIMSLRDPKIMPRIPQRTEASERIIAQVADNARIVETTIRDAVLTAESMYDSLSAGLDLHGRDGIKRFALAAMGATDDKTVKSVLLAMKKHPDDADARRHAAVDAAKRLITKSML